MAFNDRWNRRTFLSTLGALVGTIFSGRKAFALPPAAGGKAASVSGFGATGNVYEELGVTTVINGQGTMTVLGGSLMRPEVEAVMALAGRHFVSVPELEVAAGKRIAEMLKLPEGYGALVTSGRSEEHTSELQSLTNLVCRLLLEKKKTNKKKHIPTNTRQIKHYEDMVNAPM